MQKPLNNYFSPNYLRKSNTETTNKAKINMKEQQYKDMGVGK